MASLEALFQQYRAGYESNWKNMQTRPGSASQANKAATQLLKNKAIYQKIQSITNVRWWFVGLCHYRESNFNLNTYLGNGQPLDRVTTIVPKGRGPFHGPDAFIDGAVDAFKLEGFVGATDWSIARALFRLEGFNGYGYHSRGVNSPYLWGGSTVYGPPEARAGKFVADHVFDPDKVDPQLGTAVVLKELMKLDDSIVLDATPAVASGSPEPDDTQSEAILHVQQALNKLGIDPQLAEDGIKGPRTMAAISMFQLQNGLPDTGLPDAATIAAIATRSVQPTVATTAPDVLPQIFQRMQNLEKVVLSMNNVPNAATTTTTTTLPVPINPTVPINPNDPVNTIERVLGLLQKLNLQPGAATSTPVVTGIASTDQLKQVVDLITAITGQTKPPLGQVNGALGDTIGNLLNGKKTALGIGGSLITSLLAAVQSAPGSGGISGLLGTIATSVPGLSKFALPIFLATTIWGVLGKAEKWAQGTAPPPKPQV
jgi:lysozyme family protein/peptidoglycan hydrolase-like protein with peptidoglycan-binding domain